MRRLLLCAFAVIGGFAMLCQVFPGAAPTPTSSGSGSAGSLPPVETAGPAVSLADSIALIEGGRGASQLPSPAEALRWAEVLRVQGILASRHTGLSKQEIARVATAIVDEAAECGLEASLVVAVIQVESSGYHRAVSPVGALGLMQIMPDTGEALARQHGVDWYGPETLFDPIVNVRLGIAYLRELSDRYGHVPTALAAYNWGPGHIDGRIRRGAAMPRLYVEQVMRAYDQVAAVPEAAGGSS